MALTNEDKKRLHGLLLRATVFDKMMMRIIRTGRMVGFYHEGGISLAPGAAAGGFLRLDDPLLPHYRGHGVAHMLGKGVDYATYVSEHMGRVSGCCGGRSSYHGSFPEAHMFGSSGNIGFNFPMATGYGFAAKYKGTDQVVMNCSGDGSYGEGRAYEGMHLAATWGLPVVFWCENNGIAQHSMRKDIYPIDDISAVAASLGIPTQIVDGQDLFACGEAAQQAIEHARSGKGPYFVEAKVLRAQEHNVGGLNYDGAKPRSQEEMDQWREERCPLKKATGQLLDEGLLTEADIAKLYEDAEAEADRIEEYCEQQPKATPPVEELVAAVYAN